MVSAGTRQAGSAARVLPMCERLLGGAAVQELEPLGAGEVAVRLAVQVDAHAAVDVHGGVRDPVAGVGGPELGDRDLGVRGQALVEAPGGLPQRQPLAERVDVAVGEPLRDRLEGADRATELLAGLRVRRGQRQRALGDAELLGGTGQRAAGGAAAGRRTPSAGPTWRSVETATPDRSSRATSSPSEKLLRRRP